MAVGTRTGSTRPSAWSGNWWKSEVIRTRTLGLDVGDSRIGVALSDPLGIIASPLRIISRQDTQTAIGEIVEIARTKDVGLIIVGLPISMDGSLGSQALKVKKFAAELAGHTDVPVEFRDERLSTVTARRIVREVRKTTRETRYDAAAAALILQGYLDETAMPSTSDGAVKDEEMQP